MKTHLPFLFVSSLFLALPALAEMPAEPSAEAAPQSEAAAPEAPPRNPKLDLALEQLNKGRHDDALRALDAAAALPGNDATTVTEIEVARVQALLLRKKPNTAAARAGIVEILRRDPDTTVFEGAAEPVRKLAAEVRASQPLVLHDVVDLARGGRPVKLRARLLDPTSQVAALSFHYKGRELATWSTEPMRKDSAGAYNAVLRDPDVFAPEGVTDGFYVDYFLTADDAQGRTLDSHGAANRPLQMEISRSKFADEPTLDLARMLEPGEARADSGASVAPPTPWYRRWYTLTAAGVLVAGAAAATTWALTRPDPLPPHLGEITLP